MPTSPADPGKAKAGQVLTEHGYAKVDAPRIERAVREILLAVGEDPDREGLLKTPNRVARAYGELMAGLQRRPARASQDRLPRAVRRGRAAARHRVPFASASTTCSPSPAGPTSPTCPTGRWSASAKLARLVEGYARRPQVQERLTTQIADALMEELSPIGAACVIEAVHTCMTIRGAKKHGSTMVTSALRGIFKENPASRAEILALMYAKNGGELGLTDARGTRGPSGSPTKNAVGLGALSPMR